MDNIEKLSSEIYEFYYLTENNYAMASYISSWSFLGKYYPSHIQIDFLDKTEEFNRLRDQQYFAYKHEDIEKLHKDLEFNKNTPKELNYNNLKLHLKFLFLDLTKKIQVHMIWMQVVC